MKRLLATFALSLILSTPAFAAPPSQAQVERLLQVMDARKVVDQMMPAMMQQSRSLLEQTLTGERFSEADRARAERLMDNQETALRQMLAWDKIKPIYMRVYTRTLTDKEVDAMTAFYSSPEGRSVMQKMPQIMQVSMIEMQPLMQESMQKLMQDLQKELETGKDAAHQH